MSNKYLYIDTCMSSTRPMLLSLTTRRVITTQHVRDFAVTWTNGSKDMVDQVAKNMTVDVLSVSSDGQQLLVGGRGASPVRFC